MEECQFEVEIYGQLNLLLLLNRKEMVKSFCLQIATIAMAKNWAALSGY